MAGERYVAANTNTLRQERVEPEPAVSDDQLAGRGARLVASMLDGVIAALMASVAGFLGTALFGPEGGGFAGALVLATLAYVILQWYLLTVAGQTIGKNLMKIRIVHRDTGRNGGFVQNVLVRSIVNGVLGVVPFYSLVDILLIFRDDQRCLHDMLANTMVVKA